MSEARRGTAYHEAGHAVIAFHCGLDFEYVTIKPDESDPCEGHVLYHFCPESGIRFTDRSPNYDTARMGVERFVITAFAGQLAEDKLEGLVREPPDAVTIKEFEDQDALGTAIEMCLYPDTIEVYLRYCFLSASDLVNRFWLEIDAVARALVDRETLRKDEMEVIVKGSRL